MLITALMLLACEKSNNSIANEKTPTLPSQQSVETIIDKNKNVKESTPQTSTAALPPVSEFKTVEWTELIHKDDLDALLNPPSYVTEAEDDSFEDQISNQLQNTLAAAEDDTYQQALSSTRVIEEMDGQAIRIPGFIVQLSLIHI